MWECDASTQDAPTAGDRDALCWARVEVLGTVGPEAPPELAWLDTALRGQTRAVLWQAPQGLVAPLSYRRHARLDAVCAAFAARGWPVRLRRSGGGVVPQGPGILNLSLVWPVAYPPGAHADRVYLRLCSMLERSLAALHIDAQPRSIAGSFCDGRFNLAVGPRKIAGTAQYWRRAGDHHAVLAHALLLVDADTTALTALANDFEVALQSDRRYDANVITTVAREWRGTPPPDLMTRVQQQIAATLAD